MRVSVLGAGIAGLACALELRARGAEVEVLEREAAGAARGASWFAGGMLAPWCEAENSGPRIAALGLEGLPWWAQRLPATCFRGTLVVAHARDRGELAQFSRRTGGCESVDGAAIAALEPELAGRFSDGLYFAREAHLDPRAALAALQGQLARSGVAMRFGTEGPVPPQPLRVQVDCRGFAARAALPQLRGVRGEMLVLRQPEITLSRPVRVLHPRLPVYVVPRAPGIFMVGATMLESESQGPVTARSVMELLAAAYALHPAFAEAEILETGAALRPAFADNLPRLLWRGNTLHVNGLYRHGFLLAPALARRAAQAVLEGRHFPEVTDEDPGERRLA